MTAEGFISFIEYARDQRFLRVCILAWIVWDWAINLADEVTHLWSGRGPWIKVLYVFIRYAPILHESISFLRFLDMQHSVAVCRAWMLYDLIFIELLIVTVELILVVRVFVLYRISHNILRWVVCGVFISETLMMTILIVITMPMQKYSPQCSSSDSPLEIVGYWLASLLFEMFLWGLTLVKFLRSGCQHLPGFKRRSVMYIMMRDGTWAFALIFLSMIVCLVNVLTSQLSYTPRAGTGYRILLGVLSFSGSHVILNIRRLSTPQDQELSEMSFAAVPLESIHPSPNGHPEVGRIEDV